MYQTRKKTTTEAQRPITIKKDPQGTCKKCVFCSFYRELEDEPGKVHIRCTPSEFLASSDSFIIPISLMDKGCVRFSGTLKRYKDSLQSENA